MRVQSCKCGAIYSGHYHCCPSCHQRELDAMDALRKKQRHEFEEAIRSYHSGHPPLTFDQRMTLIDKALDCAYDGNGPADVEGCHRLIQFVEELRD